MLMLILIFLSGVSGLICQVVWHRYLSLLLGSEAQATAIVIAIFLGGLGMGYHYFGKWASQRNWQLYLTYSLIELGIGTWAFCFPYLFSVAMPLTHRLYGLFGVTNLGIDVSVSILLMGFPTFLMGGTLPVLTQAMSRDLKSSSSVHAQIYGWNTVGACFGALLAGYVLIPKSDLGIAITFAGMLNLLSAFLCYALYGKRPLIKKRYPPKSKIPLAWSRAHAALLGISFLSGFYLISLETLLIRLVGLNAGSSQYNFTLVVSIFVFSLGVGALVARKISNYHASRLFYNQIAVVLFLVLLYLHAQYWAYGHHLIRIALQPHEVNFYFYQGLLGVAFVAILILPIGFSGLTLPLCFHFFKDRQDTLGVRVGQLYGCNILGSVTGALGGGYLLFYWWNIDEIFKFCLILALLTVFLALFVYYNERRSLGRPWFWRSAFMGLVLTVVLWKLPPHNKNNYLQPFRQSRAQPYSYLGAKAFERGIKGTMEYISYKDGPNTSVGVVSVHRKGEEIGRSLLVNGKSDGSTVADYRTNLLLGALPGLFAPNSGRTCVIGYGTGVTVGTLERFPQMESVDVVEIAQTVLDRIQYFDPFNGGASLSPKLHLFAMDAFRFFYGEKRTYDVIVSEPSNPWVVGVENLFSEEFYAAAKKSLTSNGMLVQWIQTYATNPEILRMILQTLRQHFPYVSAFQVAETDLVLLGRRTPFTREDLERAKERLVTNKSLVKELALQGIEGIEPVLAMEILSPLLVHQIADGAPTIRLESSRLSHSAARAFFATSGLDVVQLRKFYRGYYQSARYSLLNLFHQGKSMPWETRERLARAFCEDPAGSYTELCGEVLVGGLWERPGSSLLAKYEGVLNPKERDPIVELSRETNQTFNEKSLEKNVQQMALFRKFYSALAPLPFHALLRPLENCRERVSKKTELYGRCLYQTILVIDTFAPRSHRLRASVRDYLKWVREIPSDFPSYAFFAELGQRMQRVLASTPATSP